MKTLQITITPMNSGWSVIGVITQDGINLGGTGAPDWNPQSWDQVIDKVNRMLKVAEDQDIPSTLQADEMASDDTEARE